jgi:glyoxylase-like metal-dependent hydrolase (beta-lactamase superfamily II)
MKLTEHIHLLKHDFKISLGSGQAVPRFVNSVIVFGKDITLIDSGVKSSFENIIDYIRQQQRDPSEISKLILSHSHPDHIGSAMQIKELTGCKILSHEAEKDWMEDIGLQQKQRPVPGFLLLADKPVTLDGNLSHNQKLPAAEHVTLKILHAPGHSRGSLNILFMEDNMLFTADSIPIVNDIPNYENYTDLIQSLYAIRQHEDVTVLLSSWAPPERGRDKIRELLQNAESYLNRLDDSVHQHYFGTEASPLEFCSKVIRDLKLPDFYINPIVDKAFRTHLS